jgi:hypothetical protein
MQSGFDKSQTAYSIRFRGAIGRSLKSESGIWGSMATNKLLRYQDLSR